MILRPPAWQQETLKSVPTHSQWRQRQHLENVALHPLLQSWIHWVCRYFSLSDYYFWFCRNPFSFVKQWLVKQWKQNQIMHLLLYVIHCCSLSGLFFFTHQLITWLRLSPFPWLPFLFCFLSSLSFAIDTGNGKQVSIHFLIVPFEWVHVVAMSCLRFIFMRSYIQQYQTKGLSSNPKASVGQVVDITGRFSQLCLKGAHWFYTRRSVDSSRGVLLKLWKVLNIVLCGSAGSFLMSEETTLMMSQWYHQPYFRLGLRLQIFWQKACVRSSKFWKTWSFKRQGWSI